MNAEQKRQWVKYARAIGLAGGLLDMLLAGVYDSQKGLKKLRELIEKGSEDAIS